MQKNCSKKEDNLISFITAIKKHEGPLSSLFRSWASTHKKAIGSVRNRYYKIAQKSRTDKEFCKKYFDGVPLKVTHSKAFTLEEEKALIFAVDNGVKKGRSVRSILLSLADGNAKNALRLQNKYRNYKKHNNQQDNNQKPIKEYFLDDDFLAIKNSIEGLVQRILHTKKCENQSLKAQIYKLQLENYRLKAQTSIKSNGQSALEYLLGKDTADDV